MCQMDVRALPVAHGMIELSRSSDLDDFIRYMCLWSAYNNIYQRLGEEDGLRTEFRFADPYKKSRKMLGYTFPNVETRSEYSLIFNSINKLDAKQKIKLLSLSQVSFFVRRKPQGAEGTRHPENQGLFDKRGQRINGVLNRTRTVNPWYPYYAPINMEKYKSFLNGNLTNIDLLSKQLVMLLYTVRNNLMHGSKEVTSRNDSEVVRNACPILEALLGCFVIIPQAKTH